MLIVSHDRRFLNNVVTSTLVFEGDGRVEEYLGGYEDWQRMRRPTVAVEPAPRPRAPRLESGGPKKLSYLEQRELDSLPARIAELEAELLRLEARIAGAEFYKESAASIAETLARLDEVRAEHDAVYRRWDELDSRPK